MLILLCLRVTEEHTSDARVKLIGTLNDLKAVREKRCVSESVNVCACLML